MSTNYTLTAKPVYRDGTEGEVDAVAPTVSGPDLESLFADMAKALTNVEAIDDGSEDAADALELVLSWGEREPAAAPAAKGGARIPPQPRPRGFSPFHDP